MSKAVLISGGSGFVGQNLTGYLNDLTLSTTILNRQELLEINKGVISNFETVIHLAGKAHDLKKTSDPKVYFDVNFELTKKIYDEFLASEAKNFIFMSSVKAVADVVDGVLEESAAPNPQTPYGKSKLMAEAYIQAKPLPEGKSYYILRPCMIHGPGNKGNLNLLYQFVRKGIPFPLAAFENKRSFLSIKNLCFVVKALIEKGNIPSGIYNVADDEALSTAEVVSIFASTMNKNTRLWHIPKSLIWSVARIGDKLKLPLNTERLRKLTENYIVSNHKIKTALQIKLPLEAREGLIETANSFKYNT